MSLLSFYQQRADRFAKEAEQAERIIRRYSWSRVMVVLVMGAAIYAGFSNSSFLWSLPVLFALFVILVRRQLALEDQKQLLHYLHRLNREEVNAVQFKDTDFSDGSRYVNPHHPYSHDLDLFGRGSVFQYLNRSATQLGEERLARDLTDASYEKEELTQRQEAIRELGKMTEFRQHVWALGRQIQDFSFDRTILYAWLEGKPFIRGKAVITVVRWVLPTIALSLLAFTIYDFTNFPLLLTMMVIQIAIAGFYSKKIGEFQQQLSHAKKVLGNYALVFEQLALQKMDSSLMKKHYALASDAFEKVKAFSKLVNALEARMNPIAMQFGNGLFLYDFHAVSKLEKWREQNANTLPGWLDSLATWDALLSPATLHFNFPHYAFAEAADKQTLNGKSIGHLLIPSGTRVNNDFAIGDPQTIWLITGANMAGKSTFLRALGVNFVLGRMGSPVCATNWSMPLVALRTGMRTTDSLQDHQSYFFAELHRLQSIMDELRRGTPMFILLDEILKGTNSTDKQLGSRELLKQLKEINALVVLATHDIALGDLENLYPTQVANACFEGKIESNQLTFDYTLHAGVAQKANATFLMRKMGIIPPEAV